MSHTPGPWKWWTSCSFNRLSSDATGKDGDVLHGVKYRDGVCGIEGREEDMRLIAAAPDLLAALEGVMNYVIAFEAITSAGEAGQKSAIAVADAAIKKAKGL